MPAPADIRFGAIPRHAPCHMCPPHEHHILPCDARSDDGTLCACEHDVAPGLD